MPQDLWLELDKEVEQQELKTEGTIPDWLQGTLVRNGPVLFSLCGKRVKHWFDGLGMLHAFSFNRGKIFYSNKFLRSEAYKKVFQDGSFNYLGFACDPCHALFKRFFTFLFGEHPHPLHNANVNITKIAEKFVGLTETPLPVEFDISTLKTLGVLNYQDNLLKEDGFESAHPHINAGTGRLINYIVEYGPRSYYQVYAIEKNESVRKLIASIPVEKPSYMHSFALTKNYLIFVEYPLVINPLDLLLKGKPFITNYKWQPERGTLFQFIDLATGKSVKTFQTRPFFAFHHANAYESESEIVLDLIAYPDASIIETVGSYGERSKTLEVNSGLAKTKLMRYRFSLPLQEFSENILAEFPLEFPRINPLYDGKAYRYLYAADIREPLEPMEEHKIFKIDVDGRQVSSWSQPGCCPGEPVFVPSPQSAEEDDGILLTVVFDEGKQASFLLVIDARSFKELGKAEVKFKIPLGLHGQYYQAEEKGSDKG